LRPLDTYLETVEQNDFKKVYRAKSLSTPRPNPDPLFSYPNLAPFAPLRETRFSDPFFIRTFQISSAPVRRPGAGDAFSSTSSSVQIAPNGGSHGRSAQDPMRIVKNDERLPLFRLDLYLWKHPQITAAKLEEK
jgi:hypothetical protein